MSSESSEGSRVLAFIGGIIAFSLSWITNHSILWAIFHWLCGWLYVVFWIIVHSGNALTNAQ